MSDVGTRELAGSKMNSAVFTIAAKNYLPFVRVLMNSIRHHAPNCRRFLILTDKVQDYFDPETEPFEIILSEDLGIKDSRFSHFKYTVLELCTAVKPYACDHILKNYDVGRLLYFDPDIKVLSSIEPVFSLLRDSNILLTPHLLHSLNDSCRPSDIDILLCGIYNLGFIGLRNDAEVQRFLTWWKDKLADQCVVDVSNGLFVDQRWIDFVPALFSGVTICKDPGWNVAYWNLGHRTLEGSPDVVTVNGVPLRFFHFSGFNPDQPDQFSSHQDRFRLSDLTEETQALVLDYRRDLFAQGYRDCKTWPYAYGSFKNGSPIPDIARPVQREVRQLWEGLSDPFDEEGFRRFLEVWNEPILGHSREPCGVTRLGVRIYQTREDLRARMPDLFGRDRLRFLEWLIATGRFEYQLNDDLVSPIQKAVCENDALDGLSGETSWEAWSTSQKTTEIERLLARIYSERLDLQHEFPHPTAEDWVPFLLWFLNHGRREYLLNRWEIAAARLLLGDALASAGLPWWRRCGAHLGLLFRLAAARFQSANHFASNGRKRIQPLPSFLLQKSSLKEAGPADAQRAEPETGFNLFGYLNAEMGVGEAGRSAFRAGRAAGLSVSVTSIPTGNYPEGDDTVGGASTNLVHLVNLFHVNADQSSQLFRALPRSVFADRINIGFWCWELEDFPDRWRRSYEHYTEIWTPSTFCLDAISRTSPLPVVRIPICVGNQECSGHLDKEAFGLPLNSFRFLMIFDMLSSFNRKNPLAVVEAFNRAFETDNDVSLVIKVNNLSRFPEERLQLCEAIAASRNVVVIDRVLEKSELLALIRNCDCLVSLHRSEGFGLTLAEAMYLAKPVICTSYGGNMDFTHATHSFLVGYDLERVGPGNDPYDPECYWARPRIADAIEQLRLVKGSRAIRDRRAAAGAEYIRTQFSPAAVGGMIKERLENLNLMARLP